MPISRLGSRWEADKRLRDISREVSRDQTGLDANQLSHALQIAAAGQTPPTVGHSGEHILRPPREGTGSTSGKYQQGATQPWKDAPADSAMQIGRGVSALGGGVWRNAHRTRNTPPAPPLGAAAQAPPFAARAGSRPESPTAGGARASAVLFEPPPVNLERAADDAAAAAAAADRSDRSSCMQSCGDLDGLGSVVEQSDSLKVSALLMMMLRQREFEREMWQALDKADQDYREGLKASPDVEMGVAGGGLNQGGFLNAWDNAVVPCDGNEISGGVRQALVGFRIFGPERIDRTESHRLGQALFRLMDTDAGGSVSYDELIEFMEKVFGQDTEKTQTAKDQNFGMMSIMGAMSMSGSAPGSPGMSPRVSPLNSPKRSSQDSEEELTPEGKMLKEQTKKAEQLILAARSTVTTMQRHSLSWGIPPGCRKDFIRRLKRGMPNRHMDKTKQSPNAVLRHVVEDRDKAWKDYQDHLVELNEDGARLWKQPSELESADDLFAREDLERAFKQATGSHMDKDMLDHCFSIFKGYIPFDDIEMYCSNDPTAEAESFNIEYAYYMRRKAYDRPMLIVYIIVLAVAFPFFLEHPKGDSWPGDVFQSKAVDEHLAHEEFPGSSFRKTFFDIDDTTEFWEWIFGPVSSLIWPRLLHHHVDLHHNASLPISLSTHVLGGIKFFQVRAGREKCGELNDLLHHATENVKCAPYVPYDHVKARFHHECFHSFIINQGTPGDVERDSYYVGLDGSASHPQPHKWSNFICDQDPPGHPTGVCHERPPETHVPLKDTWLAKREKLRKIQDDPWHANPEYNITRNPEAWLNQMLEPWMYHSCDELGGSKQNTWTGRFATDLNCDGYGLIIPVGWSVAQVTTMMDTLHANDWIDEQTRAVHFEFFTYNQHTDLLQRFQYSVSFTAHGFPVPSRRVNTFELFDYKTVAWYWMMLFVLSSIGFIVLSYAMIRHTHHKVTVRYRRRMARGTLAMLRALGTAISQEFNMVLFNATTVSLMWTTVMLRIYWFASGLTDASIVCQDRYPGDFESIADVQRISNIVQAFTIIMLCLGLFYRLRSFRHANMLFETLRIASVDIGVLFAMLIIIFGGLGIAAWSVYSQTSLDYATIHHTLLELLQMMLGAFDFHELQRDRRDFSPLFFVVFQLVSVILLLNMIIAVLANAFGRMQEERYDPRAFIMRTVNDPVSRFVKPVEDVSPFSWAWKLPRVLWGELRLAFMWSRAHALPPEIDPKGRQCYLACCERTPRVFWHEYTKLLIMLERGSPDEVAASALTLGALVHRCRKDRLQERFNKEDRRERRMLRSVFGTNYILSADDLLNVEMGKEKKKEVESLLILVPSKMLGKSQFDLWLEVLGSHDRWQRTAKMWCKSEQTVTMEEKLAGVIRKIKGMQKHIMKMSNFHYDFAQSRSLMREFKEAVSRYNSGTDKFRSKEEADAKLLRDLVQRLEESDARRRYGPEKVRRSSEADERLLSRILQRCDEVERRLQAGADAGATPAAPIELRALSLFPAGGGGSGGSGAGAGISGGGGGGGARLTLEPLALAEPPGAADAPVRRSRGSASTVSTARPHQQAARAAERQQRPRSAAVAGAGRGAGRAGSLPTREADEWSCSSVDDQYGGTPRHAAGAAARAGVRRPSASAPAAAAPYPVRDGPAAARQARGPAAAPQLRPPLPYAQTDSDWLEVP